MSATSSKIPRWFGPVIVAITALIMLFWSWGTWPDCVLDFGRELYVPWRISAGDLLYRDIVSYFNGPLSPYLHALMFTIFGVSLRTLVVFNLFVIAVLAMMLYRLLARAFGSLAATAGCATFFILFAFAQLVFAGNYNFLCPYSYELPHGITLSVGAILCLDNWRLKQRRGWLIAAGALLGLVFLTKAEVFVAAASAVILGLILILWIKRRPKRDGLILILAALAPIALALLLLRIAGLSFASGLRGIAGAWRWIGDAQLLKMPYFTELAGTAHAGESARIILIWSIVYAIVFGIPIVLCIALRKRNTTILAMFLFVALTIAGVWNWQRVNWNDVIRPAPIVLLITACALLIRIVRRRQEDGVLPFMLVTWSLAMLAKMALNAHVSHYGFALAMPATIVMLAIFFGFIPRAIECSGASGNLVRAVVLAALVVMIHPHLRAMSRFWSDKTIIVGEGADAFRADWRGQTINGAVDAIDEIAPKEATLAVVPEGLIVNYLTRRVNPTGQLNFTPPAIVMYGEDEMRDALAGHPPDYILFAGVDTAEYGPRFFGNDYARELGGWIGNNYRIVRTIGPRPFREAGFGAVLLKAAAR